MCLVVNNCVLLLTTEVLQLRRNVKTKGKIA